MKFPNNLYLLRSNRGLQQKEVSDAIGVGQSEYSKMERGDRKIGIHLDKLLKFFSVDQDTILSNVNVPSPHSIQHTSSKPVEDLPMYGLPFTNVVQGFQVQKKLVTHCARPDYLVGINSAYACYMLSENMEQRYFYGEILYVDPTLEVKENDFVVIQIMISNKLAGIIRKINEISDRQFKVTTLNPKNEEVFKNSDITAIHKIVGSRSVY
jgi:phage repressor protein C with HTH and peptisase S24 domain